MKKILGIMMFAVIVAGGTVTAFAMAESLSGTPVVADDIVQLDSEADTSGAEVVEVNPGSTVVITEDDTNVIDLGKGVEFVDSLVVGGLIFLAMLFWKLISNIPFVNRFVTYEQYQKLVTPLLEEAAAYGVSKLKNADWLKVETRNEAVAIATNYILDQAPDVLKKFNLTEEQLRQKLEAKLVEKGWDTKPGQWEDTKQA